MFILSGSISVLETLIAPHLMKPIKQIIQTTSGALLQVDKISRYHRKVCHCCDNFTYIFYFKTEIKIMYL